MEFAHDTQVVLAAAAALVNTRLTEPDVLGDAALFEAWMDEQPYTGERARTDDERAAVRALRERLVALWPAGAGSAPHSGAAPAAAGSDLAMTPGSGNGSGTGNGSGNGNGSGSGTEGPDRDRTVELVNAILAETDARPRLARHDGWDWHLHVTPRDAPLADRMGAEIAMSVVDLVRADDLSRLRRCAGEDCDAVLVDLSRNRSKRFCDTGNCANRAHVAAYRARRASRA
ncbi:CGNR zinc finger domain-containing protein [Pseudonocardia sp. NPDC049635]|uniref:CGNR zinc finger domain-containing protein n=1 Tax=Pseudonocardia sp. NPDC049635 TaxID=3155506 RepID=UPI0033F4C7F6